MHVPARRWLSSQTILLGELWYSWYLYFIDDTFLCVSWLIGCQKTHSGDLSWRNLWPNWHFSRTLTPKGPIQCTLPKKTTVFTRSLRTTLTHHCKHCKQTLLKECFSQNHNPENSSLKEVLQKCPGITAYALRHPWSSLPLKWAPSIGSKQYRLLDCRKPTSFVMVPIPVNLENVEPVDTEQPE